MTRPKPGSYTTSDLPGKQALSAVRESFNRREAEFIGSQVFTFSRAGELNVSNPFGAHRHGENWHSVAGRLTARDGFKPRPINNVDRARLETIPGRKAPGDAVRLTARDGFKPRPINNVALRIEGFHQGGRPGGSPQ